MCVCLYRATLAHSTLCSYPCGDSFVSCFFLLFLDSPGGKGTDLRKRYVEPNSSLFTIRKFTSFAYAIIWPAEKTNVLSYSILALLNYRYCTYIQPQRYSQ